MASPEFGFSSVVTPAPCPTGTWISCTRSMTSSTKPYSLACVGGEPAVAVGVALDLLDGLPGVLGDQLGHLPLGQHDCSAWIAMSDAVPPMPADGWCIRIRACGSA